MLKPAHGTAAVISPVALFIRAKARFYPKKKSDRLIIKLFITPLRSKKVDEDTHGWIITLGNQWSGEITSLSRKIGRMVDAYAPARPA